MSEVNLSIFPLLHRLILEVVYKGELLSLWLYKENDKLRD
jgi:hypothetical protein